MPTLSREIVRFSLLKVLVLLVLGEGRALGSESPPAGSNTTIPIDVETFAAVMESHDLPDGSQLKELLPAAEIREGQVVYYTLKIRNPSQRAAHNVVVTKPVPANTRYVADSAAAPGALLSFSVDGGITFASARQLVLKDERGLLRPAPPERYTHIRWQMRYPLAPGAVAYARFRAVFR